MKSERYKKLLDDTLSLLEGENDTVANMANVSALLKSAFNPWWVGFYIVKGTDLVLGPFQGPVACTRIPEGKGVCGFSRARKETVVVPDVHKFEGHIACSSESNSEIVVPLIHEGRVWAVLDIDSKEFDAFDEDDRLGLERLVQCIKPPFVTG